MLIEAGADFDVRLARTSLLHCQVRGGNLKLLKMLLSYQYQLNPDKPDEYGRTFRETPVELIKVLVPPGAKVEETSAFDGTPLATAARSGNATVGQHLVVECGALVNNRGGDYGRPLHAACHHGTLEMV